jgi:hypothetical protein
MIITHLKYLWRSWRNPDVHEPEPPGLLTWWFFAWNPAFWVAVVFGVWAVVLLVQGHVLGAAGTLGVASGAWRWAYAQYRGFREEG